MKLSFYLFLLLLSLANAVHAAFAEPTVPELEQARMHFIGREQALKKSREGLTERITRMRAALDAQERRLHAIDLRLDETKKSIIETEQKILQNKPK
ncbi:MAG: hypothetical protein K2X77_16650 [Candidatus Obscuribacterales bacterium]|jgi:hypothetical protein|nr:hypothetical protein [Candidatus Obscuribacterales bacterium]